MASRAGNYEVQPIHPYSDGLMKYWPVPPVYRPIPDTHYLNVLGESWVRALGIDERGEFFFVSFFRQPIFLGQCHFSQSVPHLPLSGLLVRLLSFVSLACQS